jgi:sulfur-oxidizing protein SoxX
MAHPSMPRPSSAEVCAPLRVLALLAVAAAGCATTAGDAEIAGKTTAVLKSSFKPAGQAGLDRLDQDETQRVCSAYTGKALPKSVAESIEQANLATIRYPADGKLLGDWKNGEKIAQEGRGKQFSDDPNGPVGANCYACHQLSKAELSFGTIGPSLYQYGKLHGGSAEVQRHTYGKIYNSEAFSACSNMPRFGYKAILTEQQIKDVTALLLDPASPVNQSSSPRRSGPRRGTREPPRLPPDSRRGVRRRAAARLRARPRATRRRRVLCRAEVRQCAFPALHRLPRATAADVLS